MYGCQQYQYLHQCHLDLDPQGFPYQFVALRESREDKHLFTPSSSIRQKHFGFHSCVRQQNISGPFDSRDSTKFRRKTRTIVLTVDRNIDEFWKAFNYMGLFHCVSIFNCRPYIPLGRRKWASEIASILKL
jgi:hypothetical protein